MYPLQTLVLLVAALPLGITARLPAVSDSPDSGVVTAPARFGAGPDSLATPRDGGVADSATALVTRKAASKAGDREPTRWMTSLRLGSHAAPERAGRLVHASAPFDLETSLGVRAQPWLEVAGTSSLFGASYDGPPIESGGWVSVSDHRSLTGWSLGASVRAVLLRRWLRPFAEAGVAIASTTVSGGVYDYTQLQSWFGIASSTKHESDLAPMPHVAAGFDIPLGSERSVGIEVRQSWLRGNYGRLSGGDVDVAGPSALLVLRTTRSPGNPWGRKKPKGH